MEFLIHLNWVAVGQIILIDLLLGGDNAIVIALACRNLPPQMRTRGIIWGTFGAVAIRIVLIAFAVTLLDLPLVKMIGGILLLWIGIKLLSDDNEHGDIAGSDRLISAIKTIIVADLVMSVDNVLAVASAASQAAGEHQFALVVFGILISIPIIIWGSTLVLRMMERFPIIIAFGAALLGYLAGGMIFTDAAVEPWLIANLPVANDFIVPGLGLHMSLPGVVLAVVVVIAGRYLAGRKANSVEHA
ncbi:MAG: rane protein [Herbaspirillum sp.]|jgi:YjbE family integral membrane protein|nr:rane protein [Herbaspirillum sp.]